LLQFDPVSTGAILTSRSPLNAIHNPAAIPIVTSAKGLKRADCARIVIASRLPRGNHIRWKIDNVHATSGRAESKGSARARFLESGRTALEAGPVVHVYGVKGGRIRIIAASRHGDDVLEAVVVTPRTIPFRIQLLRDDGGGQCGTLATALQAWMHIQLANIYLRQIGICLVVDRSADAADGARPCMRNGRRMQGVFELAVPRTHLREVPNEEAPQVIRSNAHAGVVQVCYLESMQSGASGRSINYPGNRYGSQISLTYRPMAGLPPKRHTMVLTPSKLQADHPDLWGLVLTNANEHADPVFTLQKYANTLAHEVGHLLCLAHREAEADDPKNDGLTLPGPRNLMHAASQPPEAEDLDLIQAVAAHGSELVTH
jgi:hypothetical protein